jgi:hypothetical protein
MPQKRIGERRKDWEARAAEVVVPDDGMTLVAFAVRIGADPLEMEQAARYLHRRGKVWVSKQRGHVRVYQVSKKPKTGRPSNRDLAEIAPLDPELSEFLADVTPVFIRVALLDREKPKGAWRSADAGKRLEIAEALEVEAMNLMAMLRGFMADNPDIWSRDIRDALWMVYPTQMRTAAQAQPSLEIDGGPIAEEAKVAPLKRVSSRLCIEEQMLEYIKRGGRKGEGVHNLKLKLNGKASREQIERIGEMLEQNGLVYSAVCRTSKSGTTATRYFMTEHGEPVINADKVLVLY